jgi:ABC-type dipeptide/oligopeptide/nickel transport system permease subunit
MVLLLPALISVLLGWWLAPTSFFIESQEAFQSPNLQFLMGTDDLGRDLFSGVVQGLRTSLLVSMGVTSISYSIGIVLGITSGLLGGNSDQLFLKLSEIVMVLPRFLIVILSAAFLGQGIGILVVTLGLFSWTSIYRIIRSEILSLRTREYILAARALGSGVGRIGARHLFPAILPTATAVMPLSMCHAIMAEAGVSFLGLGDPETVSIGYLISNSNQFLFSGWWLFTFPGLLLTMTVAGLTLVMFGENDQSGSM